MDDKSLAKLRIQFSVYKEVKHYLQM
jgi:hypothetical protein